MTQAQQIEALRAVLPMLDERSQGFAESLILQAEGKKGGRRFLSDKQMYWVGELTNRAAQPAAEQEQVQVGSVKGVVDLLERAQKHLKHPAVIVRANGRDIRLNIAGSKAKVPGSINVCSAAGGYGDRDWYGRVTRDGKFEPCRKYDAATQTAVAAALRAMASDPAKAAAEYGHLTGVCCFCGTVLTDERSTAVGYGPVCAGHFGLPFPTKREAKELKLAA